MPKTSLFYFIAFAFLTTANTESLNPVSISNHAFLTPKHHLHQRNLDSPSPLHSAFMTNPGFWFGPRVPIDSSRELPLYMRTPLAIYISSNETILSNGACTLFNKFACSQPGCLRENTPIENQIYTHFSTEEFSRINLTQAISIADGAWKINSSITYLHSCEHSLSQFEGQAFGQIGLGLSGNAYQHFQVQNPIFSIFLNSSYSDDPEAVLHQLIFGFNSSYVNDPSTAISLPCDLDWKMQVNSVSVEDSILLDTPITMIFDLQTPTIGLPPTLYSIVKKYFFDLVASEFIGGYANHCFEQPSSINCMFFVSLQDLPALTFTLKDGIQFHLPPAAYATSETFGYTTRFDLYDPEHTEVEYIILGRLVMKQYYSLFQKLENQDPMITLYPLNSSALKSNLNHEIDHRNISQTEPSTATSAEIPETQSPVINTPETSHNKPLKINTTEIFNENNKDYEPNNILIYITIGCLITIIIVCGLSVFISKMRKSEPLPEEKIERSRTTLELNESSYFVSSNNNDELNA